MSLLPTGTNANANLFYFLRGDGQLLNVSTLNATNANITNLSTANATVSSLTGNYLSSIEVDAEYINNSTINTLHVDLDGQILTANATELLLNGIPLATTSNLSSIADWSLDPAISTVQMAGNDLNAAGTISSVNIRSGNGFFQNLIAYNALFVSTQTSTISSLQTFADEGNYSTLNAGNISSASVLTSSIGGAGGTLSTLNIGAGGNILLENFGVSFASVGSAQLGFQWFYGDDKSTDMFYDTNISSVRMMTRNPGGYTDAPASRLHVPQAGISSLEVSSLSVSDQISVSSIYATLISTPQLYVSSINGSEFTSTGIVVQVAGVSSLVANSISSIGAELRTALVSTLQFNPSFSPSFQPNVNLGLGSILGNVIGWGAGVFGAAAGTVGLVTGIAALAMGRQQGFIDNSRYELINGTTQLQFSTLGTTISSIQRVSDSVLPDQIPGSTVYISTILPAGTLALRSVSDPINTVSTPNSTIQAFGPWVAVPPELAASSFATLFTSSFQASTIATLDANVSSVTGLSSINGISITQYENVSSIDWAYYPAVSTINFSTGVSAVISAANPATDNIALVGSNIQLVGGYTDAKNLLTVSSISTATVFGANDNLFGVGGIPGLKLDAPNLFFSTLQTNITGLTNCSTVSAFLFTGREGAFSTINVSSATISSINGYEFPQPIISTFETASVSSLTASTINTVQVPLIQLGRSTFQVAAYEIELPRYYTDTNWNVMITPAANTTQVPHASTASISSFLVHAGGGVSIGIDFQWTTIGFSY